MIFLYKVKLCNASLAEINCFSETAIKDLFSAAKLTVFTMLLSQRICWIQKSCKQNLHKEDDDKDDDDETLVGFKRWTQVYLTIYQLWRWKWSRIWKNSKRESNRPDLCEDRTQRLSIKLLESRPLWRSFPLSCLYSQFKICHFIYCHSCLGTERCNKRKLIHILNYFSLY